MSAKCSDCPNALTLLLWTLSVMQPSHRVVKYTDAYQKTSIVHDFIRPTHFSVCQLKEYPIATHGSFCMRALACSCQLLNKAEVPAAMDPSATAWTTVFPGPIPQFSLDRNYYYHVISSSIIMSKVMGRFPRMTQMDSLLPCWTGTKHIHVQMDGYTQNLLPHCLYNMWWSKNRAETNSGGDRH